MIFPFAIELRGSIYPHTHTQAAPDGQANRYILKIKSEAVVLG